MRIALVLLLLTFVGLGGRAVQGAAARVSTPRQHDAPVATLHPSPPATASATLGLADASATGHSLVLPAGAGGSQAAPTATSRATPVPGAPYLRYVPLIYRKDVPPTPTPTPTPSSTLPPPAPPTPSRTSLPGDPGGPVSADTALLGAPRASVEQMARYILARSHGEYSEYDVRYILGRYDAECRAVGMDPLLAVAQMIHETGNMSSFWAARPRRNPAGIGVTGLTSTSHPADGTNWAYDPASGLWRYGVSFPTWDDSVRAQVGRLLAYALTDTQANQAQRALIAEALRWRALPSRLRGSAPTLKPLGAAHNPTGSGWASPGDNYGAAIANIANRIRSQ
jgi:hypothetical protein